MSWTNAKPCGKDVTYLLCGSCAHNITCTSELVCCCYARFQLVSCVLLLGLALTSLPQCLLLLYSVTPLKNPDRVASFYYQVNLFYKYLLQFQFCFCRKKDWNQLRQLLLDTTTILGKLDGEYKAFVSFSHLQSLSQCLSLSTHLSLPFCLELSCSHCELSRML